jgi:hypothetical protein
VILFHVVASGTCWVSVGDGPRHWAQAGDVILLPYGDQHRMRGVDEWRVRMCRRRPSGQCAGFSDGASYAGDEIRGIDRALAGLVHPAREPRWITGFRWNA